MAHSLHYQRLLSFGAGQRYGFAGLKFEEHDYRPHPQAQNQDGGDDGPSDFQRGMPVGLRRQRIARPAAETDGGIEQRALDQHEHHHHGP